MLGRRSRKRIGWAVAALALVAALVMGGLYIPTLLTPEHPVPALASKTIDDATNIVAPLKFKIATDEEYSDTVDAGLVIRTKPANGSQLREKKTLHLIVSKGFAPVPVPDLSKLSEADATQRLAGAQLTVNPEVVRPYNEDITKGEVMDWSPKGEAPKHSAITLTVSNGPEPRSISNWTGKTFAEAKTGIEAAGLKVKKVDGYSDTVGVGLVVSTSPGAGKTAERGSTVEVTVSQGPLTVSVPSLSGKRISEASAALNAVGLKVGQVIGPGGGNNRHVFTSDPGPGTKVNRGTAVDLYVTKN